MLEPLTQVQGRAFVLTRDNVDTDTIIRVERMATRGSAALNKFAFEVLRYDAAGDVLPESPFDGDGRTSAPFLITGANFGCGSSREPAVWAIASLGVRCIIAPSFGDIFFNNCFQNGILPIIMTAFVVDALIESAQHGASLRMDLVRRTIEIANSTKFSFVVDERRRRDLIEGLDEIESTLRASDTIEAWQADDQLARPWIWQTARSQRSSV